MDEIDNGKVGKSWLLYTGKAHRKDSTWYIPRTCLDSQTNDKKTSLPLPTTCQPSMHGSMVPWCYHLLWKNPHKSSECSSAAHLSPKLLTESETWIRDLNHWLIQGLNHWLNQCLSFLNTVVVTQLRNASNYTKIKQRNTKFKKETSIYVLNNSRQKARQTCRLVAKEMSS